MIVKTDYWHKNPNNSVTCDICPRHCTFSKDGQRGFCFVRGRDEGEVVLKSYGDVTGFGVDPIEKKPLYHFLPGSKVLSFGTVGCNMGCMFCQNWHISKDRTERELSVKAMPKDIVKLAKEQNCRSVAFTYNEPIIFFEYARDVAKEARENGLKTVAVSAGYITPEARKEFFSFIDATNIDIKAFTEDFYKKIVKAELKVVLKTIEYVKNKTNVWLELTNLMIPGENDSEEEITKMCKWIHQNLGDDVPLHFSAFFPSYKMMEHKETPLSTLKKAKEIAKAEGLNYVYIGNVRDGDGCVTHCSKCDAKLISRDFVTEIHNLKGDKCSSCGNKCPGVFI